MERVLQYDSVDVNPERDKLILLDQSKLPGDEVFLYLDNVKDIYEAITHLKVRGAPAIGIAAAYGLCVILNKSDAVLPEELKEKALETITFLKSSRPTAVNLSWALERMKKKLEELVSNSKISKLSLISLLFSEADKIKIEDISMCERIAEYGFSLMKPYMNILTHCNAGHLAVSRFGTALGPIYLAHQRGYGIKVYADETRPLLQGARLTAYELQKVGIDVTLICDNMACTLMSKGMVDAIMVGCDRIAANGDVANKIGTLSLAVIAKHFNIPFYVLGPTTTIDCTCKTGNQIVIEERQSSEITELWYKKRMAPEGIKVFNPAFDVTPSDLVSAIITEKGIFRYPYNF